MATAGEHHEHGAGMARRLDPDAVEQAVATGSVVGWLTAQHFDMVGLALVDSSGTLRQKLLSASAAARALEDGWSFIDAIEWWLPDDTLALGAPAGSGTHRAIVDTASGRPYPFGPSPAALFLAEFDEPMRQLSPRFQLQRMVERAAVAGLSAEVGWELECIVLAGDGEPAMGDNRCWSAATMATEADTLHQLVATLEAGAVPVDHLCAELGPGCLELALAHEPAVAAADSAALAKLFTKSFFAGQGRRATFMAQLGPGFPGLGGHPSLSLHWLLDGSPALSEPDGTLTKTAGSAIAGIVELLDGLMLLAAPTVNSYRRFGPGNWAPATATWGAGNYSCALRVVHDVPASARLELRIPGADVSPHQCLAMMLGAAVWGIERNLEPPPGIDPPADGRASNRGHPLPRDITEAAERLSASAPGRELFGAAFVEHLAGRGLAEAAACHRFVSDDERARYLAQV